MYAIRSYYVPSAPGYVGTFDAPGIEVLVLYGVRDAIATAYTLVLHAALWLPITLLGAFYMLREGLGWTDFGKAVEMADREAVRITSYNVCYTKLLRAPGALPGTLASPGRASYCSCRHIR